MPNRLAEESSPYLRQHAANPVDWWPWGEAAFAEAKRLDRPVFVSIGYAACHWCHVMAHESFEDAEIARMMNALFINVKVDREERPDVDAVYMNAILVMGEGGGWPLSAFCLPDGRPYFLGTYFPPKAKFGRPSFADLVAAMSEAFATRRADCVDNAEQLADGLARLDDHYRKGAGAGAGGAGDLTKAIVVSAGKQIAERCDGKLGGLAGHPKFPSSATHALLARAGRLPFGSAAQAAFDAWAKGMADGGIYDHVGGGFARYSVDDRWLVPHFEKMLYDQAQLLGIYAIAGGERAREVIDETVAFLGRELSDADGGLWSSLDADSEGEEGKFYTWTIAQLRAALGPVDAMVFAAAYGATEGGNFEDANVLARVTARSSAAEEEHLKELRAKLFAVRASRVRPGTDDKVLAGWNGLAITGLLAANTPAARAMAIRVGTFVRANMVSGDRLARVFHHGVTKDLDGTLEDYAFCARAFLDLAEATGDRAWWDLGAALAAQIRARFTGEIAGGVLVFYLAPAGDALLVHRTESHHDAAIPSGAAIAVDTFVRLGTVAGDAAALALAETYLAQRLTGTAADVRAVPALVAALDRYLHQQVVVVTEGTGAEALRAAAVGPLAALAGPWAQPSILDGKSPAAGGAARAFVCTGPACSPPVATPAALHALLHPVHQ